MAAATYDLTNSATAAAYREPRINVVEYFLDLSTVDIGSAETAALIYIPAKTCVLEVTHEVKKVEGATLTFDLGDSSSGNRFGNDLDANSLTTTAGSSLANPQYYATADDIRILINTAGANVAQILVKAVMIDMSDAKASY